jgi:flagellum-specific peptidoglycan hydrolase FlgJ
MHATGVPASVTIAQAADESGWGSAAPNNNLFGIKGTGNAGSADLPTQEFENGAYISITAQFAAYTSWAASITAHDQLLATAPVYSQAMSDRRDPDQFARDLTGTYATDPTYGTTLIDNFMRPFNLYQYDSK